jgi:hypothetical protein
MTASDRVLEVLAAQRAALRSGDFATLERLAPRLERAIAALDPACDRATLADLRKEAGQTARLIRAAQAGLARARVDLGAAKTAVLTTYDARGRQAMQPGGAGRTIARS